MSERNVEWVNVETLSKITGKDRRTCTARLVDFHFKREGRSKLYDKTLALQAILNKGV
jgi:iron uptake system EfeUOB component EfeO/EfeM